MPQLQVERNLVVLLGSYLSNLNVQLQRLSPVFARCGDLMQRESLLTNQQDRELTQTMINQIGQALEDVSRATGSVAHFYRTLDIGEAGRHAKCDMNGNAESFKAMMDECGVLKTIAAAASNNANVPMQV